jgi:hypothetical protein
MCFNLSYNLPINKSTDVDKVFMVHSMAKENIIFLLKYHLRLIQFIHLFTKFNIYNILEYRLIYFIL